MSTFKIKPYENIPNPNSTNTQYGAIFTFCIKTSAASDFATAIGSGGFIKWGGQTTGLTTVGTVPSSKYIYVDRGDNIPYKNSTSINTVKQTINRTNVLISTSPDVYAGGIGTSANTALSSASGSIFYNLTTPALYATSSLANNLLDITPIWQATKYSNSDVINSATAGDIFGKHVNNDPQFFANPSMLSSALLNANLTNVSGISTSNTPYADRFGSEDFGAGHTMADYTMYSIVIPCSTAAAATYLEFNDSGTAAGFKMNSNTVGFTPLSLIIQSAAITSSAPTLTAAEVLNPPTPSGGGVEYTNNNSMTLITTATQYIQYNVQKPSGAAENSYKPGDTNSAVALPPTGTFTATAATASAVSMFPTPIDNTTTKVIYNYTVTDNNVAEMTSGIFLNCESYLDAGDAGTHVGDAEYNPGLTRTVQGESDTITYSTTSGTGVTQLVNSYTVDGGSEAWYLPIISRTSSDSGSYSVTFTPTGGSSTTINYMDPTNFLKTGTTTHLTIADNLQVSDPCPKKLNIGTNIYQVDPTVTPYVEGQVGTTPNITSFTNSAIVVQAAVSNS